MIIVCHLIHMTADWSKENHFGLYILKYCKMFKTEIMLSALQRDGNTLSPFTLQFPKMFRNRNLTPAIIWVFPSIGFLLSIRVVMYLSGQGLVWEASICLQRWFFYSYPSDIKPLVIWLSVVSGKYIHCYVFPFLWYSLYVYLAFRFFWRRLVGIFIP